MNRIALVFALSASLLASVSPYLRGQENAALASENDAEKTAARRIFDDAKKRAIPMVANITAQLIEQKEIELNAIRPRAEQLKREMRNQDRRGGLAGGLNSLSAQVSTCMAALIPF